MGTIGNIPPQYSQPGNINSVPESLTSTLSPNTLKQLSPAQLDAIKNLPPEKLASLNNVPVDQFKKLDPKQLQNFTSRLPNSNEVKNKLDKTQKQVKDRKDKEKKKSEELEKLLDELCEFYPSLEDFDCIKTREHILYADAFSDWPEEILVNSFRNNVLFVVNLSDH